MVDLNRKYPVRVAPHGISDVAAGTADWARNVADLGFEFGTGILHACVAVLGATGDLMLDQSSFRHSAFVYADDGEYVARLVPFIVAGLAADEDVLVVVDPHKIELLRGELGSEGHAVEFANMRELGRNPARIIPLWSDFLDRSVAAGRGVRGVGEPIHPERSEHELAECIQHEALLNVAFEDGPGWSLMCPYDRESLTEAALEAAAHTHPILDSAEGSTPSRGYDAGSGSHCLAGPQLAEPPKEWTQFNFSSGGDIREVRELVADSARGRGLSGRRTDDLVLAASEIATNSLVHGGGRGTIRIWFADNVVVCEVSDDGRIGDPLAGRRRPTTESIHGRGLWIANSLCDLVQLRSTANGSIVRLHMAVGAMMPS